MVKEKAFKARDIEAKAREAQELAEGLRDEDSFMTFTRGIYQKLRKLRSHEFDEGGVSKNVNFCGRHM